uniref:Putative secretory peptide-12 n=1 Tax=Pleurobrachia bachei TaxID=34499 RepID=M4H1D0_PLEBA|nr:putative secretory peptide-12 [Pleurobrachia bachei]|eukprot:sb/3478984/
MKFTCVLLVAVIGLFAPVVEARHCRIQALGCWKDSHDRAIPLLEKKHPALKGNYKQRRDAIVKCRDVAASKVAAAYKTRPESGKESGTRVTYVSHF